MKETGMKALTGRKRILAGITLFSMFFGAGNLIFPPFLGAQAGTHIWQAFAGFAVSAVFLPVLGVVAVTKSGGLETLASRVHPRFSFFYILVLYLAIGPCLAIPRTASTSFSIAVMPFWNQPEALRLVQLVYALAFFLLAAQVAMHPEKLTEYLGKCLTPILLSLIVIIFASSVLRPAGPAASAQWRLWTDCRDSGIFGRLSDNGYPGSAEFRNYYRNEYPGHGDFRGIRSNERNHSCGMDCRIGAFGSLRNAFLRGNGFPEPGLPGRPMEQRY